MRVLKPMATWEIHQDPRSVVTTVSTGSSNRKASLEEFSLCTLRHCWFSSSLVTPITLCTTPSDLRTPLYIQGVNLQFSHSWSGISLSPESVSKLGISGHTSILAPPSWKSWLISGLIFNGSPLGTKFCWTQEVQPAFMACALQQHCVLAPLEGSQ